MHERDGAIESAVVKMYSHHPSPSIKDKLKACIGLSEFDDAVLCAKTAEPA